MAASAQDAEMQALIEARIAGLRARSFGEIERLPEALSENIKVGGKAVCLTTFVQRLPAGELLATVQVGRSVLGVDWHAERGLVFSVSGNVREATASELQNTGG